MRNNLVIQNGGDCMGIRHSQELGGLDGLGGSPGSDCNAFFDTAGPCVFVDQRHVRWPEAARWRNGVRR